MFNFGKKDSKANNKAQNEENTSNNIVFNDECIITINEEAEALTNKAISRILDDVHALEVVVQISRKPNLTGLDDLITTQQEAQAIIDYIMYNSANNQKKSSQTGAFFEFKSLRAFVHQAFFLPVGEDLKGYLVFNDTFTKPKGDVGEPLDWFLGVLIYNSKSQTSNANEVNATFNYSTSGQSTISYKGSFVADNDLIVRAVAPMVEYGSVSYASCDSVCFSTLLYNAFYAYVSVNRHNERRSKYSSKLLLNMTQENITSTNYSAQEISQQLNSLICTDNTAAVFVAEGFEARYLIDNSFDYDSHLAELKNRISMITDMPQTELFGEVNNGLGSGQVGDITRYNRKIRGYFYKYYAPILQIILGLYAPSYNFSFDVRMPTNQLIDEDESFGEDTD